MSGSIGQSLQEALLEFQASLTPDQNRQLQKIKAVPDPTSVITFTAQLDEQNAQRRMNGVSGRLLTFLQSVQQFSMIVDTFVSSNPGTAALVWGSVKLTMLIASNFTSYFDKLSTLFMGFNKLCPRYAEYQILYSSSTRLQTSLCNFHAAVIRCCNQVLQIIQRPWQSQVFNALARSYQAELEPAMAETQRCSKDVEKEILLAKAQADYQDQQLQIKEREAASEERTFLRSFVTKISRENEQFSEWRIQRDDRNARERRKQLVDSLSTYNYITAFREARRRRHGNTAQWLIKSPGFDHWASETGCSVLWCSGKLGSGKTILTTKVIDSLFVDKRARNICISIFFCRFDEAVSLNAETILRSIIQQSIVQQFSDATGLPKDIESSLEEISQNPLSSIEELERLLHKMVVLPSVYYIIIDALDECGKRERSLIFDVLQSAIALNGSKLKLFLASRESISREIRTCFLSLQHISMSSSIAQFDIEIYAKEAVDGKLKNQDLVVGSDELVQEIKDALIQGADGMFLWVAFQIDDICSRHTDAEIRHALQNLPKDLAETFNRALLRVIAKKNAKIAKQVFQWVAAVKRPLSLEQLREAIAVEPGQHCSKPERLPNYMHRVTAWCENLIVVDEEDEIVRFAHHSVKRHFLDPPSDKQVTEFHFQLQNADDQVGEICVTYLNFNDFKTQLIRRPKSQPTITPAAILDSALANTSKSKKVALLARSMATRSSRREKGVNLVQQLADCSDLANSKSSQDFQLGHPFFSYASKYWLLHTSNFNEVTTKTWSLWTRLLLDEHSLGETPWTHEQFLQRSREIGQWICDNIHPALLQYIESSNTAFTEEERAYLINSISREGYLKLLDVFLEVGNISSSEKAEVLRVAADRGHLEVVDRLLAAKADVNAASPHGYRTALLAAARGGHLEVVDRLLAVNANVNATLDGYGMALQAAAGEGHLEVVDRLLAANADINAAPNGYGTALQAAARGGHLEVIDRLLAVNADVDAAPDDYGTALQAAARGGHLEVVDRLLAANADVNADSRNSYGTALGAAARGGHLEVVDRLLAAKADVNAISLRGYGTALRAAAGGGHLEVVDRLLAANANVNAAPNSYGTALQAAAERGYLKVVDRLLVANADVNAASLYDYGTALRVAAGRGHLKVVDRLLAANADVDAAPDGYGTALQTAAGEGHLEVIDRLLAAKADVNARSGYRDQTALEVALIGRHYEIVARLRLAGAIDFEN